MTDRSRRTFLRRAAGVAVAAMAGRALASQATTSAATTTAAATTAATTTPAPATAPTSEPTVSKLDRRAIVARHDVTIDRVDALNPLQVGNGEFAFGFDATGMQTLADAHRATVPVNTMAQWAWHAEPNPDGYALEQLARAYDVAGREVPYFHDGAFSKNAAPAGNYLRGNPHRVALARIALVSAGVAIKPAEITNVVQRLTLWTGVAVSRFEYRGRPVEVTTVAHPGVDLVAFRVVAPGLLASGDLAIQISFPAARPDWKHPDDWTRPEAHATTMRPADHAATFERTQDAASYAARAAWTGVAALVQSAPHAFDLTTKDDAIELAVRFTPAASDAPMPAFADVVAASAAHWAAFWSGGAAIDFAACTDPRAPELERRVVLSQYLTAVNCAGSLPPQETGLLFNSWYGKHHLEMHWWHAAHFAMWDRFPLLGRSLGYYRTILPQARALARAQGYEGVRWPKMTDPTGRDSPSEIGAFLIWQQPNPIYYAELAYRAAPTRETLDRYAELVDESARFMASYARHDEPTKRFVLGPALIPAQETYWQSRGTNLNPTFELAYWAWGIGVAQKWRERLGQPREARWDQVIDGLAKPTVRDGRYAALETAPFLVNADHPSFLMALGYVPKTHLIDENVMRETARWTKAKWKWNGAWGWDFPVLAQTAARLGEAELAVDALLIESEKNRFLVNGHNYQNETLPIYLPGNGGLLAAVALMAGGWDGGPDAPAPGFPKNGKWDVKVEGFGRMI